jgi:DnaJ-class molecular chaperone
MEVDHYKTLGVSREASPADIQKAYRSLARKYHPDVNPDDKAAKQRFKEIQEAYEVLNDPEKREMYDRYGSSFGGPRGGAGPGGSGRNYTYSSGPGGFEEIDLSQLFGGGGGGGGRGFESAFGDIFGQMGGRGAAGGGRRRRATRGADLKHELTVPFKTSITGGEARLSIQRPDGRVESIAVKIPKGIDDGKTIRLRGQGDPGADGTPGDLLIKVLVAPHPCYRRRGNDLEVQVPVTLAEAALGAKIDVPTPSGAITLTVPPGTSSGKRLRVKGHGVQEGSAAAGDLYVELQIVLPKELDESTQKWIRELAKKHPQTPRAELTW